MATMRKRPSGSSSAARQTRLVFGNNAELELEIPDFINDYNCYMCGVDVADQLRSYYNTQRVHTRTWKPLFHSLFDTVLGNSYLLSSYKPVGRRALRRESHAQFRRDLRNALFERSAQSGRPRPPAEEVRRTTKQIIWHPTEEHNLVRLWEKNKARNCSACIEAGRKSQLARRGARKALSKILVNTIKKPIDSKD